LIDHTNLKNNTCEYYSTLRGEISRPYFLNEAGVLTLKKIIAIAGILLVLYGYYLLSVSPDAEFGEVVRRAKSGMFMVFMGDVLLTYLIAKR
jgi:hypothetical protein